VYLYGTQAGTGTGDQQIAGAYSRFPAWLVLVIQYRALQRLMYVATVSTYTRNTMLQLRALYLAIQYSSYVPDTSWRRHTFVPYISWHTTSATCLIPRSTVLQLLDLHLAAQYFSYLTYISRRSTSVTWLISRGAVLQLLDLYLAVQYFSCLTYISQYSTSITWLITRGAVLQLLDFYLAVQ
jgi:hypothetical protein